MSLYKRPGQDLWSIDLTPPNGGRRIRRPTGYRDKRKAQREHDKLKADLWQEKITGRRLSDALVLWLKAKSRTRNEKNAIKQILREYGDPPLDKINASKFEDAFADKGPGTYNKLANPFRAALNLAKAKNWITPPKIMRKKEPRGRVIFLEAEEWERLYPQLPAHQKPMAEFSISTGLRWANVTYLEWSQVSINRGVCWVHADEAKGQRAISVKLTKRCIELLRAQVGQHKQYVFAYRGEPIASPKTALKNALKRAKITKNFTWHGYRHTWASWHIMNGTPLEVLQELGGWASIEMVQKYAHLAPGYAAQWADNAKPVSLNKQDVA
jgi:integrase